MSKLSQKELLSEGFLSTVRKLAANTVGAVAGGVYGAAKQVAKDVAAADTSASIFNVAKQGAKGMASGWNTVSKWQSSSSPEKFVEEELKNNYSSTFDPKSIKIIEAQRDTEVKRDLSQGIQPKTIKGNRFFVYFEALKYNETSGTSITQVGGFNKIKGVATVIKGGDGKFKLIELKDENGNIISNGSKEQIKNYDRAMAPFLTSIPNPGSPKLIDYATAIKRAFNLSVRELKDITNDNSVDSVKDALTIIINKQADDILDQNDINLIKKVFKDNLLAENSQLNLLKQLNLLNDSYNKTYELSKH